MSGPGSWMDDILRLGGRKGIRVMPVLNYGYHPTKDVPNLIGCAHPALLSETKTYVGAETGFFPWIGCADRVFRTMTISGSILVSNNYPGPYSSDWPGDWSTKSESRYRGTLKWSRLGPQRWVQPHYTGYTWQGWNGRWCIEVDNIEEHDPDELFNGEVLYPTGVQVSTRHWGARGHYESGIYVFDGFGWDEWSDWYDCALFPTSSGRSVTGNATVLTWSFDENTGQNPVTTGSLIYTLSDEVDALAASLAEMAADTRSPVLTDYYGYNLAGSGKKVIAQSVTAAGIGAVAPYYYGSTGGAIGTPSVVRSFYRIGVRKSSLGTFRPTARWSVVTRRNSEGGSAYYSNAVGANNLTAYETAYHRFTERNNVPGWVWTSEQAVGSHHSSDETLETLEEPITEPEDSFGPLNLADESWTKFSWTAKEGTGLGDLQERAYFTGFSDGEKTESEKLHGDDAWRFRVLIFGNPARYRVSYRRVTVELLPERNEYYRWWKEKTSVSVTQIIEGDILSVEETWLQDFNLSDKASIRDVTVERAEGEQWVPLIAGKKSGQFVMLYKLRRHSLWGWAPFVSVDTVMPWHQWRIRRYKRTVSYTRLAPVIEHCGTGKFSLEIEITYTKHPNGSMITEVLENRANYGDRWFAWTFDPAEVSTIGGYYNQRIWVANVARPPLQETVTATERRIWAELNEANANSVVASYYSQTVPDPKGEIISIEEMFAVCSQENSDSGTFFTTDLFEAPIPDDPTASSFVENVRLEPPPE